MLHLNKTKNNTKIHKKVLTKVLTPQNPLATVTTSKRNREIEKVKLNITIDLQDIFDAQNEAAYYDGEREAVRGDGYNLKETIKNEIINGLKSSISKDCLEAVEKKSKSAIDSVIAESVKKAQETIACRALEFTNDWLEKKTVISDKWGDPVNELTISELIKQQFDNLLESKVGSDGKPTNYNGVKLINYLTGQMVQEHVSTQFKNFNKDIDNQIKSHIESGIRESVSNKFAEMIVQTAKSQNKQIN